MAPALGVLVIVAWSLTTIGAEDLEATRSEVQRIMESEGLKNKALPGLLGTILKRDPDDLWALAILAMHMFHNRDFKRALKLSQRLARIQKVPKDIKSLIGHLVAALTSVNADKSKAKSSAIGALRDLACISFLTHKGHNSLLHSLVEHEARELSTILDGELSNHSSREQIWKERVPHYVPGLLARPFWEAQKFTLTLALEDAFETITEEVSSLYRDAHRWKKIGNHTEGKDENLVLKGFWEDLHIFSSGRFNAGNCLKIPKTCSILKSQLDLTSNPPGVALISQLHPGTELSEHVGATNAELTFHLGLRIPADGSAGIRVGTEERKWTEGRVLVFDDSFNHTVWHRGADSTPRTVLLVRTWHPEVSINERIIALSLMQDGKSVWHDFDVQAALGNLSSKKSAKLWDAQIHRIRNGVLKSHKLPVGEL